MTAAAALVAVIGTVIGVTQHSAAVLILAFFAFELALAQWAHRPSRWEQRS